MNKETKVGLLVGLSFIVLFGVILSNQAPDIVSPPEKPMLAPAQSRHTNAQIVRQIETTTPPPEPVDVVADAVEQQTPAASNQAAKSDAKPADATAVADASTNSGVKPAEPVALSAPAAGDATRKITADNLGPETADAEPGDDGMQMISSKVDADGTKTTVYVVKSGDSLAKIARQCYGDASNRSIDKIFEANKDKMPNKKTLQIGMKLQVPAKPAKDKSTDDLLSSGSFDEVAELKPATKTKDSPVAKDTAAPTKEASVAKDVKETKEPTKATAKDAKKAAGKTAVAEVSQETLDDILLKRTGGEQPAQNVVDSAELARVIESAEKADKAASAKDTDKKDVAPEGDKTALASRENCKHYQVQKGDTWYKLAAKFMGDSKRWHDLYVLNDDIMPNATKLRPGVKIRIPGGSKGRLESVVE